MMGSGASSSSSSSDALTMRAAAAQPPVEYVSCDVATANDTDEGRALMAMVRVEASLAQWLPDARPSAARARSHPFKFEDDMCDATRDTAFLAYRRVHDAYPDGRWRDHVQVARIGTQAALRAPGARVFAMLQCTDDGRSYWPLYFCVFTPGAYGASPAYLRALWKSVHWLAARAAGHPDAPDASPVANGGMRLLQWALNRACPAASERIEFNARRAFLRLCERHAVPLQLDLHERAHIERKQGAAVHGYAMARDFLSLQLDGGDQ